MRLINVDTYKVEFFLGRIPAYAILSHCWKDGEEVSLLDMQQLDQARLKGGFKKIEECCRQAKLDGFSYAWVDTCCIDKTSSAELSEAINSMFTWYSASEVCYAYLQDVGTTEDFEKGLKQMSKDRHQQVEGPIRWFTRGWTLQELVAPLDLVFYSKDWGLIGSREAFQDLISNGTGIQRGVLNGSIALDDIPVMTRMSWASKRTTTKKEDESYCLLGIFDVTMPLLYGEGEVAFRRLQQEILKATEDQTIFLWHSYTFDPTEMGDILPTFIKRGFLATSPHDFVGVGPSGFRPVGSALDPNPAFTSRERGIRLSLRITNLRERYHSLPHLSVFQQSRRNPVYLAALNCVVSSSSEDRADATGLPISTTQPDLQTRVAIFLQPHIIAGERGTNFTRVENLHVLVPKEEVETWEISTCYIRNPRNDSFDGAQLCWRTKECFGYEETLFLEFLDIYDVFSSLELQNTQVEPDTVCGTLLGTSKDLPWLMVMLGLSESDGMVFCDIWRVPQSIIEKVMAVEREGVTNPGHRALILSEIRVREMYSVEGGPKWRRQRSCGLLTRASCRINSRLEATVSVIGDSLDKVYIHARERHLGPTGHMSHDMAQERADEVWCQVEETLISLIRSGEFEG